MKYNKIGLLIGLATLALVSCKQSTTPTPEGTLAMETSLPSSSVTGMTLKGDHVEGIDCDSVRITRVRVLLSRIKLQRSEEDTNATGHEVKAGPAVITFEKGKVSTFFATTVPVGKYDKMKLEIHRFTPGEVLTYRNDSVFADFATADRNTFIIEGTVWNGGVGTAFTQTSDDVENVWVKAEPYFEVTESSTTTISFNFDAATWLKVGGKVKDPRDGGMKDDLKFKLKNLFKLFKK